MSTVQMRHPKRDRKAKVAEDRVPMYRSQGWEVVEAPAPKKAEKDKTDESEKP